MSLMEERPVMNIRLPFSRKSYCKSTYAKTAKANRRTLRLESLETRDMLNAVNPFGLSAAVDYNVGHDPVSIVNADLNSDGYLDLAIANMTSNNVSVLWGNNQGEFLTRSTYSVGTTPMNVVVADANNDGRLDILTANSGSNTISIILRQASGGFASAISVSVGDNPEDLAVGDVNNDGINDIVVTNTSSNTFSLLMGQSRSSASFAAPVKFRVGNGPVSIVLADFNKDGYLDAATANRGDSTASVLLGNGSGQFTSQIAYATGAGPQKIVTGVLTGNPADPLKYTDLVIASRYDNNITVLVNNGNGAFTSKGQFGAGTWSAAVAIGDMNGDGLADLVTADEGDNTISILCGKGDGTFGPAAGYDVGKYPDDVTLGDFDGDGHLDVATANHLGVTSSTTVNTVSVLLGDRRFADAVTYNVYDKATNAIGTLPYRAVLGDLNNDGYADIVTANQHSGNLSVLLNDKTGAFTVPLAPLPATNPNPRSLALGDINGDGNLDAVVCCAGTGQVGTVSVLIGNGNGIFQPQYSLSGYGYMPVYITLGDLDADGKLDIVTVNQKGDGLNTSVGTLSVAFGNGDGTFTTPIALNVGNTPRSVAVGDVDNDGFPDLVATSQINNGVSLILHDGARTFKSAVYLNTTKSPFFTALGDVDNDGDLDIVTTNYANNSISVLLGNNDGTFSSPLYTLTRFMPYGISLADFNGDGYLDVATVLANENKIAVLDGDGTGLFGNAHDYFVGTNPVSIAAADLDGNGQLDLVTADKSIHGVSVCLANGYLDTVMQSTYENLIISANNTHWYSINTGTDGVLTIEVIYQGGANDVAITLYDATGGGTALAASTATALPGGYYSQRIDYPSGKGVTYTFKITGSNNDAALHVTSGSGAAIYGTNGNDVFELIPGVGTNTVTVTTNAITTTYTFDAAVVKSYWFDGLAGTDQVVYGGTTADETAVVYTNTGSMTKTDLSLQWVNFEEVRLTGGGGTDTVSLYDSVGSDNFKATEALAQLWGTGFDNQAAGYFNVNAYSLNGGEDTATIYGSANVNTLVTTPKYAKITSSSYYVNARYFRYAKVYAGASGSDVATMTDSSGNDTFVSTPAYAKLYNNSFYTRATGFRYVKAYANAGGYDTAELLDDTTDDTFTSTPTYGKLTGPNFYVVGHYFDYLIAYANGGGNDTATLTGSTGDDKFLSSTVYGIMSGSGYKMRAQYFDTVLANAVAGGYDRAYLSDAPGNYTLTALGNSAKIAADAPGTWSVEALKFAWVQATASSGGGTHTKVVGAIDYVLETLGPWV